jgi:hypothetical protein
VPEVTGRPAYHPATLLKIYLYGYLNRIQSSRRLERETERNIELIWLTGRLMRDFKTIANFRRDSGPAIRAACGQFVVLCRQFNLFTRTIVAIDGSKFKAVNNRDKNFTVAKVAKRIERIEATDMMQLHLNEISRNVTEGAHAVLLLDRAGWHTTGKLVVPENITPILLPSPAPELNPVENIWQYISARTGSRTPSSKTTPPS